MMSHPKITFIGAGSVVFTRNLISDLLQFPEFQEATLSLMDIDPHRLRVAEQMAHMLCTRTGARVRIEAHSDLPKALDRADFVLITIQVGMHEATLKDFHIPAQYGVKQTIADTLGIGGIFRFLRTAPVVEHICRVAEEVASDPLILNYTNPMAMLIWMMSRITRQRVVGLCHSIQHTASQLEQYMNLEPDSLQYLAGGINHMAWFLKLQYQGEDVYPRLRQAMEDPETFARDPVRFEILRLFGYFVSESSEHMAEYVPYFIQFPDKIQNYQIPINEYIRRSEENLRTFQDIARSLEQGKAPELTPSREYAAYLLHSVLTGKPRVIYGNLINEHFIENLPQGCCVEVPCLVDAQGIQPTRVGRLPPQLAALNRTNIQVQELAVEGYLSGRRELILQAALLDPNTVSQVSFDRIEKIVNELMEAHDLTTLRPGLQ